MHKFIRWAAMFVLLPISSTIHAQQNEEHGTGLLFESISTRSIPQQATLTTDSYRGLPTSVSLEAYCPTAGDQGELGTCVGFATAYSLRTILYVKARREAGYTADPNAHIFSPSFVYEQIKSSDDVICKKGSYIADALELLQYAGVATLKTLPYQCGATISNEALNEGAAFKILSCQKLFSSEELDLSYKILLTKKALSEGNPCLLGFKTAKSFKGKVTDVWKQQPNDAEPTSINIGHAMCVVGYNDNKYGGAFRVLNSWGTGWGDKGFIWIPYSDFAKYAYQCYQVQGEKIKPQKTNDPVALKPDIKGTIRFQQNTGEAMNVSLQPSTFATGLPAYKMNTEYASGTRFRFYMNTSTDAYVYAFASDLSGTVNQIFPFEETISPFLGKNSTVAFPSETKVIRMDENKGTDYLLILYSKKPLDMKVLLQEMKQQQGNLLVKAKAALQSKLMSPALISYSADRVAFEQKAYTDADILPVLIEIPHN